MCPEIADLVRSHNSFRAEGRNGVVSKSLIAMVLTFVHRVYETGTVIAAYKRS